MSDAIGMTQHATGAVRSSDADNVRFDLISPTAFLRVMSYCRARPVRQGDSATEQCLVRDALLLCYAALEGDWESNLLENAADCLLEALARQDVGESYVPIAGILPFHGVQRLAETYHEGAVKYSDFNWERGFEIGCLLNHGIRHLMMWMSGDRTEDHLSHACWNIFAAIHSYRLWPDLNAGKIRGPGCKPPKR